MNSIEEVCQKYPKHITYKDDGGVQVLQIKDGLDLFTVLNDYYGN
jgi:hypothetical protein